MSTFLHESIVELVARKLTAKDGARLSAGTLLELAEVHRSRGELLSAMQYEDMAREEVDIGLVQGGRSAPLASEGP